jgi:hypothetical protein
MFQIAFLEEYSIFSKWNSNNYRLYRVEVKYKDAGASTVRALKGLLATRYGGATSSYSNNGIRFGQFWSSFTTIYGKYSPDLEVSVREFEYEGQVATKTLWVDYRWKKFLDEYEASKLDL